MKKFKFDVSWTMTGTVEVEAENEKDAREKAFYKFCEDEGFPEDESYIEDSFQIDEF